MLPYRGLQRIVSGGQTGADRAALEWAIAHNIAHAGWCPRVRPAEGGAIPQRYGLRETPEADSSQRTEWNVRDSDGTVALSIHATIFGGPELTMDLAQRYRKPVLHIARSSTPNPEEALRGLWKNTESKR